MVGPDLSDFGAELNDDGAITPSGRKYESRDVSAGGTDGVRQSAPSVGESSARSRKDSDRVEAPNVETFFADLLSASADISLSTEGEEYLTQMRKILEEDKFKVTKLPNTGAYLIHHPQHKTAMAIYFLECTPKSTRPFSPYTRFSQKIFNEVSSGFKNVSLMDTILVIPQDYPRVKQMCNMLINMIRHAITQTASLSVMKKFKYRLSMDQTRAMNHIRQVSPHGVLPYTQYGVTLEIARIPEERNSFFRYDDEDKVEYTPIFTVGGFTEFIYDQDCRENRPPFIPVVNISTCAMQYPALQFLPMVIASAYLGFINSGLYLEPFKNFGDKGPNIGQLLRNDNDEPVRVHSLKEFRTAVPNIVNRYPILAVERTSCRLDYPGLGLITEKEGMEFLKEQLSFNTDDSFLVDSIPNNLIAGYGEYYTGIVNDRGTIKDTRAIDYFAVCDSYADVRVVNRFLDYVYKPEDKLYALQDLGYAITATNGQEGLISLYTTQKCLLDGQAVAKFLSIAYQMDLLVTNSQNANSIFNPDTLRNIGSSLHDATGSCPRYNGGLYSRDRSPYRSDRMSAFRSSRRL